MTANQPTQRPTPIKTKAERSYGEQFEAVAAGLPGAPDARRNAIARFTELGLPHRRIEEWKYTDLRAALKEALPPAQATTRVVTAAALTQALGPLAAIECARAVFIDGRFAPEHSLWAAIAGASIATLANASSRLDAAGEGSAVRALNHAFASDGAVIEVLPGAKLDRPIMLIYFNTAEAPATVTTRTAVVVDADATASFIEVHVQSGAAALHVNSSVDIRIGDRAVVDHAKVILANAVGVHLSTLDARLGGAAIYRPSQLTPGIGLARHDIAVELAGEGGRLDFSGIALGRGHDHIDTTMVINHVAPGCQSRELFKTILDGNARSVFQGKVVVDKLAQKTDGKQMAKALMLSPDAEFDSKPELEIYADDVACGHGSTCAELDPDLIFYCRSRGIPEVQARALLLESFVGDAIDKIDSPDVRRAFSELAFAWLTHRSV